MPAGEEACAAMTNLADLPEKSPFPGWRGKFVRSAGMTFVYWEVSAGTVLPEHSHPHEQVAHSFERTVRPQTLARRAEHTQCQSPTRFHRAPHICEGGPRIAEEHDPEAREC